jgi:hypothetical protein
MPVIPYSSPRFKRRLDRVNVVPTFEQKFDLLKLASELAEKESDRMMSRYNLFFLIQSALGTAFSFKILEASSEAVILLSFLGLMLCYIWHQMYVWSLHWQDRWIEDQNQIIDSNPILKNHLKGRASNNQPITKFSGRQLFKIPPNLFGIAWFLGILYGVHLFTPN